jgi:hypothetical protein
MSYLKKHFNTCLFNPLVDGKMLQEYNRLAEIVTPEMAIDENCDSILRYTIILNDPASPVIKDESDLNNRRGIAAELAGIEDMDLLNKLYTHTHPYAPELMISFLRRFAKSKEFAAIVIYETCFWESCRKLVEPIDGKDSKAQLESVLKKSAIKDELDKDISRIDKYYKAFFGGDPELEMIGKKRLRPENVEEKYK